MISNPWPILRESAIYLLSALTLAGPLKAMVSDERGMRFLRGMRKKAVLRVSQHF